MLSHFRRYQKSIYIVVSVVVIFSFVFYGVGDVVRSFSSSVKDKKIGKLINGASLTENELKLFTRFISSSKNTAAFEKSFTNVLNDGVFTQDFLKTKLAHLLYAKYQKKLLPAFNERLEKIRKYSLYQHPEAPFLSAKTMWQHFCPGMNEKIDLIVNKSEVDQEFFSLLVDLYLMQLDFPGEYLRRVLINHQSQYSWLKPDPRLREDDFALFNFHSLNDWFSEEMMDIVSQFVMNAAIYSEQRGYNISKQEAKEAMLYTLASLQTKEEVDYRSVLQFIGLQESEAISIWKKILLFRRLFDHLSSSVLLDTCGVDSFASFALEKGNIDLYQMQDSFVFNRFSDLLEFQLYLEKTTPLQKEQLSLPNKFYSPSEIKQKELVKTTYTVDLAKISLQKRAEKISIRQMETWQVQESNYLHLCKKFPFLNNRNNEEERYQEIFQLNPKKHAEIDTYSRMQIVQNSLKDKANSLSKEKKEKVTIEIIGKERVSLKEIKDPKSFALFMKNLNQSGIYEEESGLYSIEIGEQKQQVLSFAEAKKTGVLATLLEKSLEEEYQKIQSQQLQNFKNEKGEYKPLNEVKDLIGMYRFSYLFHAMDKENSSKEWVAGMGPKQFYKDHRFQKHLLSAKKLIEKGDLSILSENNSEELIDQWKLIKKEQIIKKADKTPIANQVFSSELNTFSKLCESGDTLCFFTLKEKSIDEEAKKRQRQKTLDALMLSVKKELAEKMLKKMEEASALTI